LSIGEKSLKLALVCLLQSLSFLSGDSRLPDTKLLATTLELVTDFVAKLSAGDAAADAAASHAGSLLIALQPLATRLPSAAGRSHALRCVAAVGASLPHVRLFPYKPAVLVTYVQSRLLQLELNTEVQENGGGEQAQATARGVAIRTSHQLCSALHFFCFGFGWVTGDEAVHPIACR
jgi:hypothetical protein